MLAAAIAIIAEKGSDALRMAEVAQMAGVSIGSLYQFFPEKAALIRTLAERYNEQGRRCIADELENVTDGPSLRAAFARLIDVYYATFLAEPVRRDIWSGMMADPTLRAFELEESRGNAALLATAMMKGPATVAEVAEASGVPLEEVADFVNANLATGYAEFVPPAAPEPDTPPQKPGGGLFGHWRLRGRGVAGGERGRR